MLDEEEVLLALMERRRRLEEETEGLEASRSADDQPPALPETVDAGINQHEEGAQQVEDLIDMDPDERGESSLP